MSAAEQLPKTIQQPGERGRLITGGRRTDDGRCPLLLIHEADGSWTIHLGDAPTVAVSAVDILALADAIVERAW